MEGGREGGRKGMRKPQWAVKKKRVSLMFPERKRERERERENEKRRKSAKKIKGKKSTAKTSHHIGR